MGTLFAKHKIHWADRQYFLSAVWAGLLFVVSVVANIYANNYAALVGKNPVTDIVLSNVRVFDVDFLVNYGPVVILILVIGILLWKPAAIPFTIKSVALFIIIRSIFISTTHIGQFEPQLVLPSSGFLNFLGGGNTGGLFFSGHTGVPLLLALIFWHDKMLRWLFLLISVVLGTAMLLSHLHYTIDVIGAFFITPTIYHLAKRFFKADYQILHRNTGF